MEPDRSYLVCATPRSGSTLVCHALEETGVAGRPEEYFEALRHSGRPRRPEEYFLGVEDQSIRDHLGERAIGNEPPPRSPLWSRAAYDRYLEWAFEAGHDPQRRLRREADVGLLRRLRQPAAQHPRLPRGAAGGAAADGLPRPHLRPRRARQQGAPGRLAVEGGADGDLARGPGQRQGRLGRGRRRARPTASFIEEHRPQLRFHYRGDRAPARPAPDRGGALGRLLRALPDQAGPGPLRELRRRLRDQHPATCSTGSGSRRPTASSSSRG